VTLLPFCQWLADTQGSIALHESLYMYPLVESLHVLTICLFVGMTMFLDLRLVGVVLKRVPMSEVTARILPWMVVGFVIMTISGIALFYAIPVRSYQNVFFRIKMIALVLAGINALTFHKGIEKRVAEWDTAETPPKAARRAGMASIFLWIVIVVSGRMIAYNWFDCDIPQSAFINWAAGCVPKGR
jgi:hypothetical protein